MAEHTPGPWYAEGNTVLAERHHQIATVHGGDTLLEGGVERAAANAALIARAPDLHAFAQLVADFTADDSAGHMRYLHEQAKIVMGESANV